MKAEKEFQELETAASELMRCLYKVRRMFSPSSEIWHHIPNAQSLLNQVNVSIAKAKDCATKEESNR